MLIKVDDPKAIAPFQKKTLVEVVFYPDGQLLKEEVKLTGVVVRSVDDAGHEGRKDEFGIRLVDLPESLEDAVNKALNKN